MKRNGMTTSLALLGGVLVSRLCLAAAVAMTAQRTFNCDPLSFRAAAFAINGLAFAPQQACTDLLANPSHQTLRAAALALQVADVLLYRPKQRQVRAGVGSSTLALLSKCDHQDPCQAGSTLPR